MFSIQYLDVPIWDFLVGLLHVVCALSRDIRLPDSNVMLLMQISRPTLTIVLPLNSSAFKSTPWCKWSWSKKDSVHPQEKSRENVLIAWWNLNMIIPGGRGHEQMHYDTPLTKNGDTKYKGHGFACCPWNQGPLSAYSFESAFWVRQ